MKNVFCVIAMVMFMLTACSSVTQAATEPAVILATVRFASPQPTKTATSTQTPTEAPTATATATATEIPTITFTTSDGKEVIMPEFTGQDASQSAMNYLSKNSPWKTGWSDIVHGWYRSSDATKIYNEIKRIPGFKPIVFVNPPVLLDSHQHYIEFVAWLVDNGAAVIFPDLQGNVETLYINGETPDDLSNQLQSGVIRIPTSNVTVTTTP